MKGILMLWLAILVCRSIQTHKKTTPSPTATLTLQAWSRHIYGDASIGHQTRNITADISQRHYWFPRHMTSGKRAQKNNSDDVSLPRSGYSSTRALIGCFQCDRRKREHLKYLRNVYCVMTNPQIRTRELAMVFLAFSFLTPDWLFSCNTITFQKYFWCSRFSRFDCNSGHPHGHPCDGQLTAVKNGIRFPVSHDSIASSSVQLIKLKCFLKLPADQLLVLIDRRLRSIMKRPDNT